MEGTEDSVPFCDRGDIVCTSEFIDVEIEIGNLVFGLWSLVFGPGLFRFFGYMAKTNFENLDIYRLAEDLADRVWDIVVGWDRLAQNTVGSQLIRSADGIGANIAEGSGRGTDKDYLRFLKIARGSLYETKHWLRRAFKRKLLAKDQVQEIRLINEELTPKLNAYIRAIRTIEKPESQEK